MLHIAYYYTLPASEPKTDNLSYFLSDHYNRYMPYLAILGRQPAIALAELVSLYPGQVQQADTAAALINVNGLNINRLGGTVKLVEVIHSMANTDLSQIVSHLPKILPEHLSARKAPIGLSLYGYNVSPPKALAISLELKKKLRQQGLAVRI